MYYRQWWMLHHTSSLKKQWFQIGASAVIWVIHMFVYHDIIVKYIFNLALVFIYFSSNVFTFISILLFKYFLTYVLCHFELFHLFTSFTMLFSTTSIIQPYSSGFLSPSAPSASDRGVRGGGLCRPGMGLLPRRVIRDATSHLWWCTWQWRHVSICRDSCSTCTAWALHVPV